MSARFTVRDLPGTPARVEKRGDPAALAREAGALERLAGAPWAPRLLERASGRIVSSRLPGAPRPLAALPGADARRLGAVLRELHAREAWRHGGLWWWDAPARSLDAYRAGRARDAEAALAGTAGAGLATRALGTPLPRSGDPAPFRMAHGDLVEANLVWGPDGPGLVDWEFWRPADPAEDLAYLLAVNEAPAPVAAAVLEGYGDPGTAARVAAWTAIVAADAAGWYLGQGLAPPADRLLRRARLHLRGAP